MPYLGNVPAENYAQVSYQDLTGGSGTSFTLDYPVGSAGEIEVFVNNVRQEPTVAYTVNGTALTMTGSVAATDDFYVVFQGKAEKSGTIPEKQTDGTYVFPDDVTVNGDLTIDTNTLFVDSTNNRVGMGNVSPQKTLDVRGELAISNGTSSYWNINRDDSDGSLTFTDTDTSERLRILTGGGITFNGDTATANALSDYEEGTGSSVTISGSSSGSATVPATMYYVKIGDIVNVSIQITNQTFPTFSGDLRCSLPFTCKSGTVARGGDCYWYPPSAWDTQTNFVGVIPQTVGTLAYAIFPDIKVDSNRQTNIGSSNSSLSGASGVYLNFSLTYQTA